MTLPQRIAQADRLGRTAFLHGHVRTPALDPALTPLLVGNECLPVLTAWTRAWDQANLAAPVDPEEQAAWEREQRAIDRSQAEGMSAAHLIED